MKNVSERIQHTSVSNVIKLNENELKLYSGAGWKLAKFNNCILTELLDPCAFISKTNANTDNALELCLQWVDQSDGEIWLVLCGSYQLIEPEVFDATNNAFLERFANLIESMCL